MRQCYPVWARKPTHYTTTTTTYLSNTNVRTLTHLLTEWVHDCRFLFVVLLACLLSYIIHERTEARRAHSKKITKSNKTLHKAATNWEIWDTNATTNSLLRKKFDYFDDDERVTGYQALVLLSAKQWRTRLNVGNLQLQWMTNSYKKFMNYIQ